MAWKGQTPEQHRAAVAKSQQHKLNFLRSYKRTVGCVDCGWTDVRALQLDHKEYDKKTRNNVRNGAGGTNFLRLGWDALLRELEWCDVVCANCHAIRTVTRAW